MSEYLEQLNDLLNGKTVGEGNFSITLTEKRWDGSSGWWIDCDVTVYDGYPLGEIQELQWLEEEYTEWTEEDAMNFFKDLHLFLEDALHDNYTPSQIRKMIPCDYDDYYY